MEISAFEDYFSD